MFFLAQLCLQLFNRSIEGYPVGVQEKKSRSFLERLFRNDRQYTGISRSQTFLLQANLLYPSHCVYPSIPKCDTQ